MLVHVSVEIHSGKGSQEETKFGYILSVKKEAKLSARKVTKVDEGRMIKICDE